MLIAPGTRLGKYEIRSRLGAGSMGEVYMADDVTLHRMVAIKFITGDLVTNKDRIKRFQREAYAASGLNHPNILTVHEVGQQGELHFIVMEFIEGVSLGRHLQSGPLDLLQSVDTAIQIAAALAAAHNAQ